MTTLVDLFNLGDFNEAIRLEHVRVREHPAGGLWIANYTERCAYSNAWTPVTLACRGLIYRYDGSVVARPFEKFFNYGQPGCPELDPHAPAEVLDKVDGSLGILYPAPDGWAIATRGSFASEQAIHATKIYRDLYDHEFAPPAGWTVLVEIVYPENRIVVDYGYLDDLILLGAVEIDTGRAVGAYSQILRDWPGLRTAGFGARSLADALAMRPRSGAEGVVVRLIDTGQMVKIKQDEYVRLHRIITGLTARRVWEHLARATLDELIEQLPDEFHSWVSSIAREITDGVNRRHRELNDAFRDVVLRMPDGWQPRTRAGRGTFAQAVSGHPDRWAMFAILDAKDIWSDLWRRADPGPNITPSGHGYGEDTA